jgi:hypothetical protein
MTFYRQDCVVASPSIRGTARCWICVGAYREGYGALVWRPAARTDWQSEIPHRTVLSKSAIDVHSLFHA